MKNATCCKCAEPGFRFRGDRWLCIVHNRIDTMQSCARSRGKYIPTTPELEAMFASLIAGDMKCETCGVVMQLAGSRNDKHTVSLQHDACGTIRFLCRRCNSRHGQLPGDTFYSVPAGHKRCPACEAIKPIATDFYTLANRTVSSLCKPCRKAINKQMWTKYGAKWAAASKGRQHAQV